MLKIKPKGKKALSIEEFNNQTPLDNAKLARVMEVMIKNHNLPPWLLAYIVTGENVKFDAFSYEYEEPPVTDELATVDADLVAEVDFEDLPDTKIFYDNVKKQLFYMLDDQVQVIEENVSKIDALRHFENKYSNIRWNTRRSLDLISNLESTSEFRRR